MALENVNKIERDAWDFLVAPPVGADGPLSFDFLRGLAEGVAEDLGTDEPTALSWLRIKEGWTATLSSSANAESASRWLTAFAARLPAGVDVRPVPRPRHPRHNDPAPSLTLGLAFSVSDEALNPSHRYAQWGVGQEATRRIAEHSLIWLATDERATTYVSRGSWSALSIGLPPAPSMAEAAGEPRSTASCSVYRPKPVRHRHVTFERQGRMGVQDVDATRSTTEQLTKLLECVRWLPSELDYAFMTYSHGGHDNAWMSDHFHYHLPSGLTEPDIRYNRSLLRTRVPDAFGMQVLRREHLERATNLDDWDVEEVTPDRFLVQARDLEPWLRTPQPHPDNPYRLLPPPLQVVTRARADFGTMILDRQSLVRPTNLGA